MRHAILGVIFALATSFAFEGCGHIDGNDSESHFLEACTTSCGAGLVCLCGVCTKSCTEASECTAIDQRAECVDIPDGWECRSSAVKACDVACLSDDGCSRSGAGQICLAGRCRPAGSVAVDASAEAADGAPIGPTCSSVGYPDPPGEVTAAGAGELVFAEFQLRMGEAGTGVTPYADLGFNLDVACTSAESGSSPECTLPAYATGVGDGTGGIDNAFGGFLNELHDLYGDYLFSSAAASTDLVNGAGLLVRLTGYNQRSDDSEVNVAVLQRLPQSQFAGEGGIAGAAQWGGQDVWHVDYASLVYGSLDTPRFVDPNAYVTSSVLVARMDALDFPIGIPGDTYPDLSIPLRHVVMTCAIDALGTLDCTVGGRVRADDLLHQLWRLTGAPDPVCVGSARFTTLAQSICAKTDIAATAVSTTCDALSVGLRFTALRAYTSWPGSATADVNPCAPSVDPENETCATVMAP